MIYHIATEGEWKKAQTKKIYFCKSLKTDGFVHCSSKDQVLPVANYLFKGRADLVLLYINEDRLQSKLVFEDLKGHGTFPHVYGPINLDAVEDYSPFPSEEDGSFLLPNNVS